MTGHEAKKAATKKNAGVVYEGDAGDGFTFEVYYCKRWKRRVWTLITPEGTQYSTNDSSIAHFLPPQNIGGLPTIHITEEEKPMTVDIKSRMRRHEKIGKIRRKTKIELLVQEAVTEAEAVALEKKFLNQIKTEYPDYKNENEAPTGSRGGKKHGGSRKGAGRKPIDGTQPEMKSVKLCQEHWNKAREIGDGNMAKGLRLALDAWKT